MTINVVDKQQPGYKAFLKYMHKTYPMDELQKHIEVDVDTQISWIKVQYDDYIDYLKTTLDVIETKEDTVHIVDNILYDEKLAFEPESQVEERYHSLLEKHQGIKEEKILAPFPYDIHLKLADLKQKYPHCKDIIDMVDAQIYLQKSSEKPYARIPHIIFDGCVTLNIRHRDRIASGRILTSLVVKIKEL